MTSKRNISFFLRRQRHHFALLMFMPLTNSFRPLVTANRLRLRALGNASLTSCWVDGSGCGFMSTSSHRCYAGGKRRPQLSPFRFHGCASILVCRDNGFRVSSPSNTGLRQLFGYAMARRGLCMCRAMSEQIFCHAEIRQAHRRRAVDQSARRS
jgi:hypothetical protein